jgi:hypothetical protein
MLDVNVSEQELRHELIDKIKNLDQKHLLKLYQFVAQSYAQDLVNMVADAENAGEVNNEPIEKLIKQHRNRNPYR